MTEHETVKTLIDAGRILEAEGQGDFTRGHVSVRTDDDATRFHMKPHSVGFAEMTLENVVVCDLEGNKISGGGRRHSEVFIHSEIYKVRDDVRSIIHSHPPHAVAFSSTGQSLEAWSQPGALFVGSLPVFADTIDLIRSPQQGAAVAHALGRHSALLLRGHGVVAVGSCLEEAVVVLLMLENACKIHLLTSASGAAPSPYSREDVLALRAKLTNLEQYKVNFNYLRRKHAPAR